MSCVRIRLAFAASIAAVTLTGCTGRVVQITTTPTGAAVSIDGKNAGVTPVEKSLGWGNENDTHRVTIQLADFESESITLTEPEARAQRDPWVIHRELKLLRKSIDVQLTTDPPAAAVYDGSSNPPRKTPLTTPGTLTAQFERASAQQPWPVPEYIIEKEDYERQPIRLEMSKTLAKPSVHVKLERIREAVQVEVVSDPPGAMLSVNGNAVGKTPVRVPITFSRSSASAAWSIVQVKAELPDFETQTLDLAHDAVVANAQAKVILPRIRFEAPIDITSNVQAAAVEVDGKPAGVTPLRQQFLFARPDGKSPWPTHLIVVHKDGYRYRPANSNIPAGANPPFSCQLGVDDPAIISGKMAVTLERSLYYQVKLTRFRFGPEGATLEEVNTLSQIGEIEREPKVGAVTRITDFDPDKDYLIETRIWVLQDNQSILYSIPFRLPGTDEPFMNLWMQRGGERTRVTDANTLDLEAGVSPDGLFVYFTSNRLGVPTRFNLWRAEAAGRGGLTKITDSPSAQVDSAPVVSPDGTHIAYHSLFKGSTTPHVWVAKADGTLPTQLRVGHSPYWSPDGTRLVYVAPDAANKDKIWVMDADGSRPTQITSGSHDDRFPVWTPDGKRIVFASNEAINEEGQPNFDIWMMSTDGTDKTQLTVNGSEDTRPAISPDGNYIYFISTRGAKKEGEQPAQIWRMQFPKDYKAQTQGAK